MSTESTVRLGRIGRIAMRAKELGPAVAFVRGSEENTLAMMCEVPR